MSALGLVLAAAQEMRANTGRTAISMLSVAVGVAAVALVVALGDIGREAAVAALERQTGRAATISIQPTNPDAAQDGEALDNRVAARATELGALAVSPVLVAQGPLAGGGHTRQIELDGVSPALVSIRRLRMVAGRWLSAADSRLFAPVLVVNQPLANDLGVSSTPGSLVLMNLGAPITARIVGLVDDGLHEGRAYAPLEAVRRWGPPSNSRLSYLVWVTPTAATAVADQLSKDAAKWGLQVEVRRTDDSRTVDTTIAIFQLIFLAIAGISLVTGGLGILNVGLATVRQRAREFGIRRAFGAPALDIFGLVLIESGATAGLAGIAGVAVATLGTALMPRWTEDFVSSSDLPGFPIEAAVIGMILSISLGIAAGLVPAWQATKLQVIDAIRN
jgi:putative ABC transport system permease protein